MKLEEGISGETRVNPHTCIQDDDNDEVAGVSNMLPNIKPRQVVSKHVGSSTIRRE